MNKRIILFFIFLLYVLANVVLYAFKLIDTNTLSLIITLISCILALLPLIYKVIDDYLEAKKARQVTVIESSEYDKDLKSNIERKLNELNANEYIVDSVQIVEDVGYNDRRKSVYIIYH